MADWFASHVARVQQHEGFTPKAKWDRRQWSNGYGTRAKFEGETIDEAEARRRLEAELTGARNRVLSFDPTLDDGTAQALADLTYNGGDDWTRAGLGQAVKARDWNTARQKYLEYTKAVRPDGTYEELPGLVKRRSEYAPLIGGGAPNTKALAAELQAGSTMAAPTVIQQGPKRRDLYNAQLAQQLMGAKPTTGNAFEGATAALARGFGTYYTLDHEAAQAEKKQALVNALTAAKPGDATMGAYADLDPGEALKLELQDRRDKANMAREDARTKAAEDRADGRNSAVIAAENARAAARNDLERTKYVYDQMGEANDAKNWTAPVQKGAFTFSYNSRTGGSRKFKGGQLIEETPGSTPPVVPGAGGIPAVGVNMNPPMSNDGTMPPPPAPSPVQPARVGPTVEAAQTGALAPQPVAAPAAETPPVASAGAAPSIPGLTYSNGKYQSPLGYEYGATRADGTAYPEDIFMSRSLLAQDDKARDMMLGADAKEDETQRKSLTETTTSWKRIRPMLDAADEAIKSGAKTGYKGNIVQTLRNIGVSLGVTNGENLTPAQLIEAIGLRSTPQVRQGLPGSVSNYEMQLYAKAVIGIENTPEANYILNRMMRLQAKSADVDEKVAQQFLRDKRESGQIPLLDEGYRARLASEYEKNPVFNDKERQLAELAAKGFKVADLDAFANGKKTFDEIVNRGRKPRLSSDGTMPAAATPGPSDATFPGAPPVGTVMGEHVYLGGDPSKESSWRTK